MYVNVTKIKKGMSVQSASGKVRKVVRTERNCVSGQIQLVLEGKYVVGLERDQSVKVVTI